MAQTWMDGKTKSTAVPKQQQPQQPWWQTNSPTVAPAGPSQADIMATILANTPPPVVPQAPTSSWRYQMNNVQTPPPAHQKQYYEPQPMPAPTSRWDYQASRSAAVRQLAPNEIPFEIGSVPTAPYDMAWKWPRNWRPNTFPTDYPSTYLPQSQTPMPWEEPNTTQFGGRKPMYSLVPVNQTPPTNRWDWQAQQAQQQKQDQDLARIGRNFVRNSSWNYGYGGTWIDPSLYMQGSPFTQTYTPTYTNRWDWQAQQAQAQQARQAAQRYMGLPWNFISNPIQTTQQLTQSWQPSYAPNRWDWQAQQAQIAAAQAGGRYIPNYDTLPWWYYNSSPPLSVTQANVAPLPGPPTPPGGGGAAAGGGGYSPYTYGGGGGGGYTPAPNKWWTNPSVWRI